jgi:ATP-dependent DNA ligase
MSMLLGNYQETKSKIKFPCAIEPKIDGVRCIIKNGKGISRTGKIFKNLDLIIPFLPKGIWDGELHIANQSFGKVAGFTRNNNAQLYEKERVIFHIFDVKVNMSFEKRRKYIIENIIETNQIKIIEQKLVNTKKEINEIHEEFVKKGFEGSVIKNLDGYYILGRSEDVLKNKDYHDAEFKVISYTLSKTNGDMVVWCCENGTDLFDVVLNCNLKEHQSFLKNPKNYIGKYMTVHYKEIVNGIPREPRGKCFKD